MNLCTTDGKTQSYDMHSFWQSSTETNGAATSGNPFDKDYKNLDVYNNMKFPELLIVVHDGTSRPTAIGWRQWKMDNPRKTLVRMNSYAYSHSRVHLSAATQQRMYA